MYTEDNEILKRIIGQTPVKITGAEVGSEDMVIVTKEGNTLRLRYEHDCCARCEIIQIDGDIEDLIGNPLVMCEDVSSEAPEGDAQSVGLEEYSSESFTWTFYKFATVKGYVTIRWYGSSNGYYSESVSVYYNGRGNYDWRVVRQDLPAGESEDD